MAYTKTNEAPLSAPNTSVPLVQKQLPENVMWLSDGRGFRKRPGSLPFAKSTYIPSSFTTYHADMNWPCSLLAVRTPEAAQGDDNSQTYKDPLTLLSVQWNGIAALKRRQAFTLPQNRLFTRSTASRTDTSYYVYPSGSSTALGTVGSATQIGEVAAAVSPTATANTFSQQALLGWQLRPEKPSYDPYYPAANTHKPYSVYQQETIQESGQNVNGTFRTGANSQRAEAFYVGGRAFVSGGAGTVLHYDGFRCYVAGAYDLAQYSGESTVFAPTATLVAAGSLTGAYQYMFTHIVRTPAGEEIEGNPTLIASATATAENIRIDWKGPAAGGVASFVTLVGKQYRLESFTTSTTGTTSSIVINESHSFQAGEYLTLFVSGVRHHRKISLVTGQALELESVITLSGTTHVSTGGALRLYRTKAGGSVFYVRRDFAYGETPSVSPYSWLTDSAADNTLVTEFVEKAFDCSPAPSVVVSATEHQGRIVALALRSEQSEAASAGISPVVVATVPAVYFTAATSPLYFPRENTFQSPQTHEQDRPIGLISQGDVLYVFHENSIHYVTGKLDTEPTYTVATLTTEMGCLQSRALAKVGNSIYFLSQQGLTRLTGSDLDSDWSAPVRKYFTSSTKVSIYHWRSKHLLLVSLLEPLEKVTWDGGTEYRPATDSASGATVPYSVYLRGPRPGKTLVFNLLNRRWAVWDVDCYNGAVEVDGDLVIAPPLSHSTEPTYFTRLSENCNWTDSGTAFTARYYSAWQDNGQPAVDKTFNRLALFSTDTSEVGGQGFQLTVKTEKDWSPGSTLDEVALTDFRVGEGYAEQPYATTPYGDPERPYKVLSLTPQKVKSLRVVLENSEPNGDFCINAMSLAAGETFENMTDL